MATDKRKSAEHAHDRLDDHAESLEHHDRRISVNENYRLQAQGALKVLVALSSVSVLGYLLNLLGIA